MVDEMPMADAVFKPASSPQTVTNRRTGGSSRSNCKEEKKEDPAHGSPGRHVDVNVQLLCRQVDHVDCVAEEPFWQLAPDRGGSDVQQLLLVVLDYLRRRVAFEFSVFGGP